MLPTNSALGLDKIDLKILDVLQREGRITKARLAEQVNLTQTPCGARIVRLERAGLIRGYHADLDLRKLAKLSRFLVTIKLVNGVPEIARRFEAGLQKFPNVVECEAVLGDIDYVAVVVATSVAHYLQIIEGICAQGTIAIDYTTYPVSKAVKRASEMALLDLRANPDDAR